MSTPARQHGIANTTLGAEGLPRRAFTIEDVEKMLAVGIQGADEKFELIRGPPDGNCA